MSILSLNRIKQLRASLEAENIDLSELSEIEEAFKQFPDENLRDLRENAMAVDMLDELETLVSPLERELYEFIAENFGHNEADDPCYDLGEIANHLESKFEVKEKKSV